MKKLLLLTLISIFTLSCSNDEGGAPNDENTGNPSKTEESTLIAFKKQENTLSSTPTELIELNRESGQENLLASLNGIDPIRSTVYDKEANQIFAIANREDENGDYVSKLIKVSLSDFNVEIYPLEDINYYNIVLDNNNKLIAFKKMENSDFSIPTELIEIDKSNGEETLLSEINGIDPIRSTVYDESSNAIFAIANREDENGDYVSELVKVNLLNYNVSKYELDSPFYYDIVLDNNSKLIALKKLENSSSSVPTELIELNKSNGNEAMLSQIDGIDSAGSTAYDSRNNEIYAISDREDENGDYVSKLVKIKLSSFNVETYPLEDVNYYKIVLKN